LVVIRHIKGVGAALAPPDLGAASSAPTISPLIDADHVARTPARLAVRVILLLQFHMMDEFGGREVIDERKK